MLICGLFLAIKINLAASGPQEQEGFNYLRINLYQLKKETVIFITCVF